MKQTNFNTSEMLSPETRGYGQQSGDEDHQTRAGERPAHEARPRLRVPGNQGQGHREAAGQL